MMFHFISPSSYEFPLKLLDALTPATYRFFWKTYMHRHSAADRLAGDVVEGEVDPTPTRARSCSFAMAANPG